jgi:hypothetical protein
MKAKRMSISVYECHREIASQVATVRTASLEIIAAHRLSDSCPSRVSPFGQRNNKDAGIAEAGSSASNYLVYFYVYPFTDKKKNGLEHF